jgi:hypothetical protein
MIPLSKFPPSQLAKICKPSWTFPKHLQIIEKIIINLYENDDFNNLILAIPLRHGKTEYVCRLLCFALLLHNSDENILLASYSASFSAESVAQVRDWVIQFGKKINGIEVDDSWSGKDYFRLKHAKGSIRAISVGSKFGGADATTLIADDLYADSKEAASVAIRRSVEGFWHGQFMGRKTKNSSHPPKTILIGTPKHPDDLQAQLEAANPDLPDSEKWVVHRLPAINEKGEALWPEFYPIERLMKIKANFETMGEGHQFDTLYLCNPKLAPEGGWPDDYLNDLFYDKLPNIIHPIRIMAADPNMGARSGRGDFGCVLAAIYDDDNGDIYIEDCYLSRATYDKLEDAAVNMLLQFQPKGFLVETNVAFKVIADNINKKAKLKGMTFPPIYHKTSTENKLDRIDTLLSPLLNQKKIHLRDISGNRLGLMQMKSFPTGENDDYPDCIYLLTQMIAEL